MRLHRLLVDLSQPSPITGRAKTPNEMPTAQPAIATGIPIRNPARNEGSAASALIPANSWDRPPSVQVGQSRIV
jgi:hypothetical protein